MKEIFDYVVHLNHHIPKETCDKIVDSLSHESFYKTSYQDYRGNLIDEGDFKHYESRTISNAQIINSYIQKLLCRYELRNRNSLVPWAHQSWSEVTFLRYTKEQRFKKHIDHVSSIFDGERKGIPILTIIGWLNNNFEGGEFHLCDRKIDSKVGDVIMFPSNFVYPHEVKPIMSGVRYSWVTWVW